MSLKMAYHGKRFIGCFIHVIRLKYGQQFLANIKTVRFSFGWRLHPRPNGRAHIAFQTS